MCCGCLCFQPCLELILEYPLGFTQTQPLGWLGWNAYFPVSQEYFEEGNSL